MDSGNQRRESSIRFLMQLDIMAMQLDVMAMQGSTMWLNKRDAAQRGYIKIERDLFALCTASCVCFKTFKPLLTLGALLILSFSFLGWCRFRKILQVVSTIPKGTMG